MAASRYRPLWTAAIALVVVWLLSWAGFVLAKNSKITPDMVGAYAHSLDLSKLSADDRTNALHELARKYNALTLDERRGLQLDPALFAQMTADEKNWYLEATLPTEVKQALAAFDQLPEDRRQRIIDNAIRGIRARADAAMPGAGDAIPIDPAMVDKIRTQGLKTFYDESTPETKLQLTPFLDELQNQIQNMRGFR
jgi:hypothetical protein